MFQSLIACSKMNMAAVLVYVYIYMNINLFQDEHGGSVDLREEAQGEDQRERQHQPIKNIANNLK